jgi:O-antigen ligase
VQGLVGTALHSPPFRINWEGGRMFSRPPGFNARAWVAQFNHSLVTLVVLPYIQWKRPKYWILIVGLFSGVILPQIRAVIGAFVTGFGTQLVFSRKAESKKELIRRFLIAMLVAVLCIGAIAYLRPGFTHNISTGAGRDKIFAASIEIFKHYPNTGIGGGRYFQENYQKAWVDLGWHTNPPSYLESHIGHSHSDYLMLLVQHGWPALLLWLGFVIHALRFAWRYGSTQEKIVFTSLVIMHQVAGLAETYLDYSNTTYAIALCYGLALHGPFRRYQVLKASSSG